MELLRCLWPITFLACWVTTSPVPDMQSMQEPTKSNHRYAKLGEMYKTTSKEIDLQNIVKINNTEDLTDFIWNFIEESSKNVESENKETKIISDSPQSLSDVKFQTRPEKVSVSLPLESLGTIKQRLSHYISTQPPPGPVPKSLRDGLETEDDVSETISKIVAEQENMYQEGANDEENLQEQLKIIQDHYNDDDNYTSEDEIIEVYVNGELVSQSEPVEDTTDFYDEAPIAIGPENKVTWTLSAPKTPNSAMMSQLGNPSMASQIYEDDYDYNYEESDSVPEPSLMQPPHIVASNALTSLNDLFQQHLNQKNSGHLQQLMPLDLITKLQQSPINLPESETLNIILTPGGVNRNHPNIAILPTSDLPEISSNISNDIGVDIEAILSSLAGSASKIRNEPMIVEENHTQLIKQPGRPTTLKIKETMSEILGDSNSPQINVLSNKEEENSFQDLESLIRQVTGETVQKLPMNMPKSSMTLDDQLKLNVSTKTNIVNIFAFNIYPTSSSTSMSDKNQYQINDFSSLGTSIKTQANVLFQPPGVPPTHIESMYDFQSQPTPAPTPPTKKNTIDKILGAVLLSQLEGGGSERVIEALGQSPEMMSFILNSNSEVSTTTTPSPPLPVAGGLYPEGIDNLSEYSPGPYGTIARNNAIQKLIMAMSQADDGTKDPQHLVDIMNEMPDYAKLLLKTPPTRQRAEDDTPLGPLGYPISQAETSTSGNTPVRRVNQQDLLRGMGGSAAAALMAGAVVTYPYWLPLLAGRRRRRKRFAPIRDSRDTNPEISNDWLAYLTGSKYNSRENINKRLNHWVTQDTNDEGVNIAATPATEIAEDDQSPRRRLKDKVRVSLTNVDTENVQEWRNNYIEKGQAKEKPELYSNYYPLSVSEKRRKKSTISTSTITTTSTTTTTTKVSTTTRSSSTTSTTVEYNLTPTVTSSKRTSLVSESLLFWTTARPKFRKPTRKTTSITSTTETSAITSVTTSTTTENSFTISAEMPAYLYGVSTLRNVQSTLSTTTKSSVLQKSSLKTTPRSEFMWFTKKPIYQLSPSSTSPSTISSTSSQSSSVWWRQKPSNIIKLSAVIGDSTSTTTKSIFTNQNLKEESPTLRPNFNNKYVYNQPITRTPAEKLNWSEKFAPVKATNLFKTEIVVENPPLTIDKKKDDFLWLDDVAPKSSIVNMEKKVSASPSLPVGKTKQKEVNLPKWPYVENLWNKVDKIMGDLLEPEDLKSNKISSIENVFSSLNLDTSVLEEIENESLYNSLNSSPSPPTTTPATQRPDQEYWQNLKRKYGFISAYTEHYSEKTTEKPELPKPSFYSVKTPPFLNEIVLETELKTETVAPPTKTQTVDSSNILYFDSTLQPPSQPYDKHPNILVAKRNISSSNDVLDYLNELMKDKETPDSINLNDKETTMRSFFKPDLLPTDFSEDFPILKEIDKVQESLVTQSVMGEKQFNWLTAEDILKAAEDSEQKITHSPIVLIPYDKEDEAETSLSIASNIPKDFFYNNFAILDSLSNQLIDRNEISSRPESNFNDIERDEAGLNGKISNFLDKNNLFTEDQPSPESTTFQSVEKKNFNSLKNEVLLDSEALSPPSPPQEVLIQSVPIQTLSLDKPLQIQPSIKPEIENTVQFNALPIKFFNAQNFKPHVFDGASKTSEKELVKFIQNLMNQAKREQEDLKVDITDDIDKVIQSQEYSSTTKSDTVSPSSTSTTIATTTLEPSTRSIPVQPSSTSTTSTATSAITAPLLPFRTTLRTTTELTTTSTTTDGSASGVITKLLSEAAAPIAGLSAATLAYSAAAMLPVWLPAALAGRKRKSFDVSSDDLQNIQIFLERNR